jgi:hypothetical protein
MIFNEASKLPITLSEEDSEYLRTTSTRLGISETELLLKGFKLMMLYSEIKNNTNTENTKQH